MTDSSVSKKNDHGFLYFYIVFLSYFIFGIMFYYIHDNRPFVDAVYFTVVMISTVGYVEIIFK